MGVEFKDYSVEVKEKLNDAIIAFLYEAGGEIQGKVIDNTEGDSGDTRKSWKYKVSESEGKVTIGSNSENAIWEEFGTGVHAEKDNGRKTPWYVPVEKVTGKKKPSYQGEVIIVHGKNGQDFYKTDGKKPKRAFQRAFTSSKPVIKRMLENKLKGLK